MAQDAPKTSVRGTKQQRRRQAGSRPQSEASAPVDVAPQIVDDAFERPADQAALREARIKAMATPATARKKMKTEIQASRPVRAQSVVKPRSTAGAGLFARRSSVLAVRPRSKSNASTKKSPKASAYKSVYKTNNPSMIDRRDFQKEHDKIAKEQAKATRESRKAEATKSEKPKVARRSTEPTSTIRRSSTSASSKPPLRKTATTVKAAEITANTDLPSKADKAESVISTAKSAKSQRSSLLGSIFSKPPPVPEKQVSCLTCGSDDIPVSKSARLPCTHRMCHSCLKRIFKLSISDPAHMPPRCCTEEHIDLDHVKSLFNDEFKKTWNRKFKEYTAKNRVYCPRKGCGEWIQTKHMRIEHGRKIGVCPKCRYAVCAICNQKAHKSRECPKDPTVQQFNEMAEKKGWVKCYNCKATVELKEGCNHMTCRCTAEFCMVCGKKWKSCDCPWFNYAVVHDLGGDPIRYQQEMDRRREQEQRDEEMARQMAGLGMQNTDRHRPRRDRRAHAEVQVEEFAVGNNAGHHMNFFQQARDALTAAYPQGDAAARGLLGGWLTGANPGEVDQQNADVRQGQPARRRTNRSRHAPA